MTTKTAAQLTRGDVVLSEQGPSRVDAATPDGNRVNVDLITVDGGIAWGDSFPASFAFTLG